MKWINDDKSVKLFTCATTNQIAYLSAIASTIKDINDIKFLELIDNMIDSRDISTIILAWEMVYYYKNAE